MVPVSSCLMGAMVFPILFILIWWFFCLSYRLFPINNHIRCSFWRLVTSLLCVGISQSFSFIQVVSFFLSGQLLPKNQQIFCGCSVVHVLTWLFGISGSYPVNEEHLLSFCYSFYYLFCSLFVIVIHHCYYGDDDDTKLLNEKSI